MARPRHPGENIACRIRFLRGRGRPAGWYVIQFCACHPGVSRVTSIRFDTAAEAAESIDKCAEIVRGWDYDERRFVSRFLTISE